MYLFLLVKVNKTEPITLLIVEACVVTVSSKLTMSNVIGSVLFTFTDNKRLSYPAQGVSNQSSTRTDLHMEGGIPGESLKINGN